MARVKINKLPKGFKLVDGKVKKTAIKRDGGMTTGDQADYGLVTTPQEFYGSTNFNNTDDQSVRYSLSSVPREDANIEAEGGETVLTDLNGNNQFGLYNINGPRHSSGGVPMFLPEQSFVFSDTNAMKFDKSEMAEFGIESRKKITPAKISKKYQLNDFYAAINSEYADDISTRSAELMLDKNMYNLSKLAFGQELKKGFEEGVPLASFPYLQEQGIDPIEFTAQMENQTKQQAELEFIASLPPEKQDQVLRLQAMMQQIENPDAGALQESPQQEQAPEYAQDITALSNEQDSLQATLREGGELDKYQGTGNSEVPTETATYTVNGKEVTRAEAIDYVIRNQLHRDQDGTLRKEGSGSLSSMNLTDEERAMYASAISPEVPEDFDVFRTKPLEGDLSIPVEQTIVDATESESISSNGTEDNINVQEVAGAETNQCKDYNCNPLPVGHPQREEFEQKLNSGWALTKVYDQGQGKTTFTVTKPLTENKFEDFGNFDFVEIETSGVGDKKDVYTELERELIEVYQDGAFGDNVRVREGIYSTTKIPGIQAGDAGPNSYGGDLSTEQAEKDFRVRWDDAIKKVPGFDYGMLKGKWSADGKRPVDAQAKKYHKQWTAVQNAMQEVENEFHTQNFGENGKARTLFPGNDEGGKVDGKFGMKTFNKARSYIRTEDPENMIAEVLDPETSITREIDIPDPDRPDWWWQDLNNIATQNSLENPLFLPNIPRVPNTEIDYVLDDWTGRANMTNAALNTMAKNLRAFGKGKVAGSNLFGKAVNQLAKDVGNVNTNNIKIMNSVALPQAQLNLKTGLANAKAYQDEYDGTVTALSRYTDFENWDKQKSNELYNQAITNRANTFNLNQLKDYIKIDESTGGIESQKGSKPLQVDPDDRTEQQKRSDLYIAERDRIKEQYPDMDDKSIDNSLEFILDGYKSSSSNNKVDDYNDRMRDNKANNPQDLGYAPSVKYQAKNGGSGMKKFAYPFYTGKMGA